MAQQVYKRSQYLVAKEFQLKYVGVILALMLATAVLCAYVVYYTAMVSMGEKLALVYPQGRLISIIKTVNFRILFSLVIVTPLVVVLGIVLSHRIAGPIYRIEKFLNTVSTGDLSARLTLRKNDEFINVATAINTAIDSIKSNIREEKAHIDGAMVEIGNIRKAVGAKGENILLTGSIDRLVNDIHALNTLLDKYKM